MAFFKKLVDSFSKNETQVPSNVIEEVESALDGETDEQSMLLAATALLLGRVAFADMDISASEAQRIGEILEEDLQLPKDQAKKLAHAAIGKSVLVHLEDHLVLRKINEAADRNFKKNVLHALFHLAAVDDISGIENEAIRNISVSLGFAHSDFIEIRSAYREYLSVLKS